MWPLPCAHRCVNTACVHRKTALSLTLIWTSQSASLMSGIRAGTRREHHVRPLAGKGKGGGPPNAPSRTHMLW